MKTLNKKLIVAVAVVLVLLFSLFQCSFKSEPEKVWHLRSKVVGLAISLIGFPYKYGGTDIQGFDCSGFVSYVYGCYGLSIPRTAKKQAKIKTRVATRHARPGDLVVFKLRSGWHTGILVGRDFFVHSPSQGGRVRKESLNEFWTSRLKRVVQVIQDS